MIVYQYDNNDFYMGPCDDYGGPMPHNCQSDAPPPLPWVKKWAKRKKTGQGWDMVDDHRARRVEEGFAPEHVQAATDYWLPDDGYGTPARHMTEIDSLPDGALTSAPEKPLDVAQSEKMREIAAAHERALSGAVALSDPTPSTVAVESSLLAVSDPTGLEWVRDQLATRRAGLEAKVHAATTVTSVEALTVSYAV